MKRVIPGFMLIDLRSQLVAVKDFTDGWQQNEVLDWLKTYGEVYKHEGQFGDIMFHFHSHFGLSAGFKFDQDGHIFMPSWG